MAQVSSAAKWLANKYLVDGLLAHVPVVGGWIERQKRLLRIAGACGYEPGHFYSPIPSIPEIRSNARRLFSEQVPLDVDLNLDAQRKLLGEFKSFRREFPYDFLNARESPNLRYKWVNGCQYRYSDVVFLYCAMRHLRPRRIVEVGCGSSSAVILDVNDLFFNSTIQTSFIDPYPAGLHHFLKDSDRQHVNIIAEKVQDAPIDIFESLDENDILFIDSSHTVKIGSDVNHLVFEILPRLRKGVCIHFHDVFYAFELPEHWILRYKRFWNESYLLRAFLMNNDSYEIWLFNTLLQTRCREWFEEEMPECLLDEYNTGSIWLRKTK